MAFLIGAFVMYSSFLRPAYAGVNQLRGKLDATTQLFQQQNTIISGIQDTLSKYQGRADLQETVSLALPNRDDVGFLIYQTVSIVKDANLNLTAISFNSAGASRADQEGNDNGTPSIARVIVNLELNGSYDALKEFLKKLETNIRLMDISSIDIKPIFEKGVFQNAYSYTVSFTSYYQNEQQ